MDKISVIVPVYKVEKYLDKCIGSILNQTYKNIELILVDDGSPDDCPQMCDKWANKDERIKVIHKKNGGLSDARNFGIDAATGSYFMFVDSDDYIDENMCKYLYELIKKNNSDISMCAPIHFYENQKIIKSETKEQIKIFSTDEAYNELYAEEIPCFMTAWAKLYKAEIFKDIRYPVKRLHEDEWVIHRVLGECDKVVVSNIPMYYYLQRSNSIMATQNEKNIIDKTEAFEDRMLFMSYKKQNNDTFYINHYLDFIKRTYCYGLYSKNLKKFLLNKFKSTYKIKKKHRFKDLFFMYLRFLYVFLFNLKFKGKKNGVRN